MAFTTHAAFRCKNCGHIESADAAGENDLPHACSCCGAGVVHAPHMKKLSEELARPDCTVERRLQIAKELVKVNNDPKVLDPSNWECLCDMPPERLKELGLKKEQVVKHAPKVKTAPKLDRTVAVHAEEKVKAQDK